MHLVQNSVALIEPYIAAYGSLAVFVIIYFESLGAPLPGESLLVAISVFAARGHIDLAHALTAAFFGAILGDSTGYLIGRFGGRPLLLRFGSYIALTAERLLKLEMVFRSKGIWIVMSARFFAVLRQLNGLVAGSVAMPWLHFLFANIIGAAAWVLVWGLGPYLAVDTFEAIFRR
ncbi:membrane protein DedA with SNARE-associated domain [Mesorhizobium soli]|jgi:membrane protein DedA with SNARE-associated domain|uniref:DedA family protein n=1 Tax=Pseudaminobacter soli (ex Li et al. 2025) TaxID=1295366 RepID=UPI0024744811|nr:DedA family protein [Mesorhizobium soli]MDH6229612.1 membrane protein DedA with SNARE-associated domain [Mesorhizobium soli]